jgi:hypothetical protein
MWNPHCDIFSTYCTHYATSNLLDTDQVQYTLHRIFKYIYHLYDMKYDMNYVTECEVMYYK